MFGPLKYLPPEKEKVIGSWRISASSLGEGAFGRVKRAEHAETKQAV